MLMHLEEKEKERITKTNSFVSVVYQISKVNHQEKKGFFYSYSLID